MLAQHYDDKWGAAPNEGQGADAWDFSSEAQKSSMRTYRALKFMNGSTDDPAKLAAWSSNLTEKRGFLDAPLTRRLY